eukprot:7163422-Alexandrium_andersonii.AAC.1
MSARPHVHAPTRPCVRASEVCEGISAPLAAIPSFSEGSTKLAGDCCLQAGARLAEDAAHH